MNQVRHRAALTLAALPALFSTAGPVSGATREVVSRELEKVLSAPEFERLRASSAFERWLLRVIAAIGEKLEQWFGGFSVFGGGISSVTSMILAAVVGVAFVILGVVVYRRLSRGRLERVSGARVWFEHGEETLTSAQLIRKSDETAATGDTLNAFRLAYLAILVRLDELGAIKFKHDKTNWEYLAQINAGRFASHQPALRDITRRFDCVFYGKQRPCDEDYESAKLLFEKIERPETSQEPAEVGA